MILSVFITVISDHDKPQPPGCLLDALDDQELVKLVTERSNQPLHDVDLDSYL